MPSWMLIVIFFVLVFLNCPISVALGCSAFIMMLLDPNMNIGIISGCIYNGIAKYVMLAIPYFVLAGIIMEYSGISRRLVTLARTLVGHWRGGLIIVVCAVSCFFGAISGSGTACIAAIGGIMIPAMVNDNYERGFASALLSISAGIGMVIPPSIQFVVYAMVANVSIIDQFTAGIVPGLMLGLVFALTGLFVVRKQDIQVLQKATGKEVLAALKDAAWGLMSPVIILGGIYTGIFTPTEAAGISVIYCIFVGLFVYKELKLSNLKKMAIIAASSTAMIMFIIAFASVFAWYLSTSGLSNSIANLFLGISTDQHIVLLMMIIVFLIAGCFIDPTSIAFIIVPVFLPVLNQLEINLFHFGVVYNVACLIGLMTPPVGTNLYVGAKIGGVTATENARHAVPFIISGTVLLLVLTYVPWFSTCLL